MVKLMETKLLWTGPSLRVKVASGVVVEAEAASEAEVVAEVAAVDLVAEAGEASEVSSIEGYLCVHTGRHVAQALLKLTIANHSEEGRIPCSFVLVL